MPKTENPKRQSSNKSKFFPKNGRCYQIIFHRAKELEEKTNKDYLLIDMLIENMNSGLLDVETVISEAVMFIFAGHETTTRLLCGFLSRIAQHPEIVMKIRAEIKEKIMEGSTNVEDISSFLSYEKIQNLDYTSMCLKEALRIDPPASNIPYVTKKSFNFHGVRFFKGMGFKAHIPCLHNDPLVWHSPREFIPERFDSASVYYKTPSGGKRHPMSYIPFMAGPRNCLGQNLANLELKYLAIYLIANFNFEMTDEMRKDPDRVFMIGIESKLPLRITKVNDLTA